MESTPVSLGAGSFGRLTSDRDNPLGELALTQGVTTLGGINVGNLYDRIVAAMAKLLGREDLEGRLLLRVLSDPSMPTDLLELAVGLAEKEGV